MRVEERLIKYCKVFTVSDPKSTTSPSSMRQFDLAKILVEEMKEMGMQGVELDEYCYVYGYIPSNLEKEVDAIGFIAHMDTAPDFNGENVHPRMIEQYDGKDIPLNEEVIMRVSDFPQLPSYKGQTLLVTDGTSLLGADDKAGIASILQACEYWLEHPEVKHGKICVGFTPDEEVGRGTEHFDIEKFGAKFAYTMDGGEVNVVADETFNAASAEVDMKGFSIHPGSAKDKMVNALNLGTEFHALLPVQMRPEYTSGYEGFNHLNEMQGNTEECHMEYIIRNHDHDAFEKQIQMFMDARDYINSIHGDVCTVKIQRQYQNMKEVLKNYPQVSEIAKKAIQELGMTPETEAIRGGTDGAMLSFKGLPCPNLGAGGGNFHGRYEYCVMEQLKIAVQLIIKIASIVAE